MHVEYIVIHCSDSPNFRDDRANDIHRWHLERGFDGIGYHYVICVDGEIEGGRPEYWDGSHVRGYNKSSIGVCLIGRDEYTHQQWDSLRKLILELHKKYPKAQIVGHCDLNPIGKPHCPGFDVKNWFKNIEVNKNG